MTFLAGQILTADDLNAEIFDWRPVHVELTGDQSVAANTTLANVSGLLVPVAASRTYRINFDPMHVDGAGTAQDIKYAMTFPAGAELYVLDALGGTAAGVSTFVASDMSIAAVAGTGIASGSAYASHGLSTSVTGANHVMILVMSTTAGNLQVQAAQNSAGAGTVLVKKKSSLMATRLV